MKTAVILTSILLGFSALAGCGGSSHKTTDIVPSVKKVTGREAEHHVVRIQMPQGRTILCIESDVYGAISCNWEAYNKGLGS